MQSTSRPPALPWGPSWSGGVGEGDSPEFCSPSPPSLPQSSIEAKGHTCTPTLGPHHPQLWICKSCRQNRTPVASGLAAH